jgi:prepilin-type processing-associated H-X9-DG protein
MNYRMTQFDPKIMNDAPTLWFGSINVSQLRKPAETIWICDNARVLNPDLMPVHNERPARWSLELGAWNGNGFTRFPQDPPNTDGSFNYYQCCYGRYPESWRPAPIHQGGTNVAFADGHVKWYKTEALVNPPRGTVDCLYDNGG